MSMALKGILAVFLICLTGATGLQIGKSGLFGAGIAPELSSTGPAKTPAVSNTAGNSAGPERLSPEQAAPVVLSLSAAAQTSNSFLAYLWPLAGTSLLIYGFWRILVRKDEHKVKDSPDFRNALAIWDSVIVLTHLTPRATKRFMNRVRCLAMRLRPTIEAESRWSLLRRGPDDEAATSSSVSNSTQLPESCLVALSAMYDISPQLVRNEQMYAAAINGSLDSLSGDGGAIDARVVAKFREALEKHRTLFREEWPPSAGQRSIYLELFSDFTVRG